MIPTTARRLFPTGLILGLILRALAPGPVAGEAEPDPRAKALLAEVVRAYQALPAYADAGEFVLAMTLDGHEVKEAFPVRVALVRPNKVRVDTNLADLVTDGKVVTTSLEPLKKYATAPAPRPLNFDTLFTEGSVGSVVFGGPGGPPMLVLLNLLLADDPAKALSGLGQDLNLGPDSPVAGTPCQVLRVTTAGQPGFELFIDPASKLLRSVAVSFEADALKQTFPAGQIVKIDAFRWNAGPVETKPLPDTVFTFDPPKGFAKVSDLTTALDAVGEPAPKAAR